MGPGPFIYNPRLSGSNAITTDIQIFFKKKTNSKGDERKQPCSKATRECTRQQSIRQHTFRSNRQRRKSKLKYVHESRKSDMIQYIYEKV